MHSARFFKRKKAFSSSFDQDRGGAASSTVDGEELVIDGGGRRTPEPMRPSQRNVTKKKETFNAHQNLQEITALELDIRRIEHKLKREE